MGMTAWDFSSSAGFLFESHCKASSILNITGQNCVHLKVRESREPLSFTVVIVTFFIVILSCVFFYDYHRKNNLDIIMFISDLMKTIRQIL